MTTSTVLRIINGLFWIGVWVVAIMWTESWGRSIFMAMQAFVPAMLWLFIHFALRPGGAEA